MVAVRWQRILIGVKLDSSVASCGMKTYSEGRIELRNLHFLNKMLKKSGRISPVSPVSRKAWMLPLILQELKNTLGKLAIAVNLEAIRFEF